LRRDTRDLAILEEDTSKKEDYEECGASGHLGAMTCPVEDLFCDSVEEGY